ncbi:putative aaa family protein [Neofusicoccum parvum UCRNP2]|uniref:Putative aaa family protein n=1 Tax=Botryosphaeria parva (strain UCR-NP2) TaxID=1287680 RepID=R1EFL4_BOTPV|nr:putative aaa family protein [Neofusicoccum parvum UCRNP2]
MGKLFYNMGLLSTDVVVEYSAADLIGQHVGHTVPKVGEQLKRALGKVLLIDAAYRLMESGYAAEAIEELGSFIKSHSDAMIVILAGDAQKIYKFLSAWPVLSGLFLEEVVFENLKPKDCVELLDRRLKQIIGKPISSEFLTDPSLHEHQKILKAFTILVTAGLGL